MAHFAVRAPKNHTRQYFVAVLVVRMDWHCTLVMLSTCIRTAGTHEGQVESWSAGIADLAWEAAEQGILQCCVEIEAEIFA